MAVKKTEGTAGDIESVLSEARVFPPPESFSRNAHIKSMAEYRRLWDEAHKDPKAFWGARGREEIYWKAPFKTVLEWKPPHARWYVEGKALPKTRSGKIMRRLLREIATGQTTVGDTTTLEDFSVLAALRNQEE